MKFMQYLDSNKKINKETGRDDEVVKNIISLLDKDCKPYLRELKKSKNFMYRGSSQIVNIDPGILSVIPRKNRTPRDKDLTKAISKGYEVMFKCKDYYLVNIGYIKDIKEYMEYTI